MKKKFYKFCKIHRKTGAKVSFFNKICKKDSNAGLFLVNFAVCAKFLRTLFQFPYIAPAQVRGDS